MSDGPDPVDIHVGKRLKLRRTLVGMSQDRLGELLGITFQQIQKYERGTNRVGSSRLFAIGRILDVPVAWFFEGFELEGPEPAAPAPGPGLAEDRAGFVFEAPPPPEATAAPSGESPVDSRETLELVRAFNRIHDPQIRRRFYELAKALAAMSEAGQGAPPVAHGRHLRP